MNIVTAISNHDSNNSTTKDLSKYYRYYRNLELYFLTWYLPITILVGFIGGTACIIFLIVSKLFPKNVLIWMVGICVGDLMILGFDATRMMIKVYFGYDFRDIGDFACKMHNFLSNYFFYWSSYMQACMSVQRLTFMLRPLQARSLFTDTLVMTLFSVISVLIVCPTMPYLLYWQIDNKSDCSPIVETRYQLTTTLDMIFWGIIPLVTMTASTIGISWALFTAKSERSKLSSQHQTKVASEYKSKTSLQTTADNAWHVTKLLIGMNVLYLVSSYPLLIYQIYLNSGGNKVGHIIPQPLHKAIYYFLRSVCYLGCSWNWVFYCLGGRKFRERAICLVRNLFKKKTDERKSDVHVKLVTL